MKTNKVKKFLLITLTVILAMAFTACANVDPSDDGSDVEMITVKLNITYGEDVNAAHDPDENADAEQAKQLPENVKSYKMHVENSATVLQIIQSYAAQENIEILVDDSSSPCVTSINGVAEYLEDGNSAGWIYEVNGESTDKDCAEYVPEDGDEIEWKFVKF